MAVKFGTLIAMARGRHSLRRSRFASLVAALGWLTCSALMTDAAAQSGPAIPPYTQAPSRYHFAATAWYTDTQGFGPYGGPYCYSQSFVRPTPWEACDQTIASLNFAAQCNPCGKVICPPPYTPASVTALGPLYNPYVRDDAPYDINLFTYPGVENGTSSQASCHFYTSAGQVNHALTVRPVCPAGTTWTPNPYGPAYNGSCLTLHCPIGSTLNGSGQCQFAPHCPEDGTVLSADGTTCSIPGPPGSPDPNENADSDSTCKPVTLTTGAKRLVEVDLAPVGLGRLQWTRTYNSMIFRGNDVMSSRWTHTYSRRMWWKTLSTYDHIGGYVFRPDGTMRKSTVTGAVPWIGDRQAWALSSARDERLFKYSGSGLGDQWIYIDTAGQAVEHFVHEARDAVNYWGRLARITFSDGVQHTLYYSTGALGTGGGSILDSAGNPTTTPLPPGLLVAVVDSFGRTISLGYDSRLRLVQLVDPGSSITRYTYDVNDHLTGVIRPDGTTRQYLNNESQHTGGYSLPHAVTGVIDERGQRVSTYQYDGWGRATRSNWWSDSAQTVPVDRSTFSFNPSGRTTTITNAIASQLTVSYQVVQGRAMVSTTSQPAGSGCGPASSTVTYDVNANISSRTDFNGYKTCYVYDLSRNLETKRVEGLSAAADCFTALSAPPTGARVISTQWHPDWHLKTRVAEPKRITTTVYNGYGAACAPSTPLVDGKPVAVVCSKSEQATTDSTGASAFNAVATGPARTWTYSYATYGRVLTATDPNNRTTTSTYHPDDDPDLGKRGNVSTVMNGAGHVTHFTNYNLHSLPTRIVDANSQVTTLTYDVRMRLRSRTQGTEVTLFDYDPAHSQLTRVVLPNGATLTYAYDTAHRLTSIVDHKGNRVDYTLDAMGNRITEKTKDPGGVLVGNIARVIDALNRVQQVTGSAQ